MATVSFKSFAPTDFAQFSRQIREQQGTIPKQHAQQIADHFKVPLATVLALREELLAKAHTGAEQVGKQTRDQREMAGGWQQPVGTVKVSGVGVNRFMFQNMKNDDFKKPDAPGPQPAWTSLSSDAQSVQSLLSRPLKRDSVELDGKTYTRQDLLQLMDQVAATPAERGFIASWDVHAQSTSTDPVWTSLSSERPTIQGLLNAKVDGDRVEIDGKVSSRRELEQAKNQVSIASWDAQNYLAGDDQQPDFAWPAAKPDQKLELLRALLDAFTKE